MALPPSSPHININPTPGANISHLETIDSDPGSPMDTSTPLDSENEQTSNQEKPAPGNLQMYHQFLIDLLMQQKYLRSLLKQDQWSSQQETATQDFCKYTIEEYFEWSG